MAKSIEETKKHSALSGWPMILAWLAMLIFAFHASTHMVGAGDTWVAMACGRHFLNHGVDTIEPFSANSHKVGPTEKDIKTWPGWAQGIANIVGLETVKYWHPTGWVNQNWLTHVIFYWLTHESPFADAETFSFNTLVYWKFAIYILTVICVYYTGRLLGVNPALSAVFACFAMFVGRSFFDIRPAGFSNLLVAVFLLVIVLATYRNILYIYLSVPLAVFWCNVHGGYIYIFIMLAPFVALNLLTCLSKKRFVSIGLKGVYHTIAAGFVAFVGTIIFNPFHLTNLTHTFIISVSEHAKMWRTVNEWHPAFAWTNPVGTGFPFLILLILSIGLLIFWLASHLLKPRFLKAPKNELEEQKKLFTRLSTILGCGAAVFICWVTFLCFSFLNLYSAGQDGRYRTNDDILDAASFLICAVFVAVLLLSIYKSVHWIYLIVPLTLLALWSGAPRVGYTGRYIYPFVLLPTYITLHILVSLFSKTVKIKPKNIIFPAATTVVVLFLMVAIFNPFKFGLLFSVGSGFQSHLNNGIISPELRQKFEQNKNPLSQNVTVSAKKPDSRWLITDDSNKFSVRKEQQKLNIYKSGSPVWHMGKLLYPHRLRRAWRPVYEKNLTLTYKHLFPVLYIVNIASIIIWLTVPYLRRAFNRLPTKLDNYKNDKEAPIYQLPKIDLALMFIAALTVFMAYRSRRFIPIAAIAACPIIAMFIDQMTRTISAARNFHRQGRLSVSLMPYNLQMFLSIAGVVAVLAFGVLWGLKFKCVYLDPWPTDTKLNSVFMRMTASDAKPFYACKFIKDNKLQGKMFNYWTEGGFIAWGQKPDPNTGRTPLQLFMDGRAQAAYEPGAYQLWSTILRGGPTVHSAGVRGRKLTTDDYVKIGRWIDQELKKRNVWVILMPTAVFDQPFIRGLEHNPNWPVVFLNNKQKLLVDISTPQGKELFDGIFNGKTLYPDDWDHGFSKNLILAHSMLLFGKGKAEKERGLGFAIKAFQLNPSQAPMQKILSAAGIAELRPRIYDFCKKYFDDFMKNKNSYANRYGYHHRTVAAVMAAEFLLKVAQNQKNTELAEFYAAKKKEYIEARSQLLNTKRW